MPPWIYCHQCRKKYYPWTTCGHLPPRKYATMDEWQKFIPIKKEENT